MQQKQQPLTHACSLLESPRFTPDNSPSCHSPGSSHPSYERKSSATISNLFSSPLTQATVSSTKCDPLRRAYTYPRLVHDAPTCELLPNSTRPTLSGSSLNEAYNDDVEDSVTKLHELITSYYPPHEAKNFKRSDAHAILDRLLAKKTHSINTLGDIVSKDNYKGKKKDYTNLYKSEDFSSLVSEFERIYSSALKNKQLHNESLQKEEELADKLLLTQLMYDSVMKGHNSDQETL